MTQTQLTDEGVAVITPNPTLKLCRADLNRIPKTGEKWAFDICAGPTDTTPTMCLLMDTGQAVTGGKTIGWVDIPLVAPQGDGNA
jgi:hypothetical protein